MQSNLNNSFTIAEFQEHIDKTQRLLDETNALNDTERKELNDRINILKEYLKKLEESGQKIGVWDSIWYNIGWDWENTGLQQVKNVSVGLKHFTTQLVELHQKMTVSSTKYEAMRESVTFLARNFQSLIDSNQQLITKVDSLEDKMNDQNNKLNDQNNKLNDQGNQIKELSEQNKSIQEQNRMMQEQNRMMKEKMDNDNRVMQEQLSMLIKLQLGQGNGRQVMGSLMDRIAER